MSAVSVTRVRAAAADARVLGVGSENDREAVVFVHGNPGSAEDWTGALGAVPDGLRAVAVELPDFGQTAAPSTFEHSITSYARFLDEALAQLGIESVHLVLHDFGGPIGLAWAADHLDALRSITLVDTGLLPDYQWHRFARLWRTPLVGEVLQASTTRLVFRFLLGRGEPRGLPRNFVDRMFDFYDRRTRRAVLRLYRATDDPSALSRELTPAFAERSLPALVVWGEHDSYIRAAYASRQREAFPDAEVHVLAASGHWPFVDSAATFERVLGDFLARVTSGAGAALDSRS